MKSTRNQEIPKRKEMSSSSSSESSTPAESQSKRRKRATPDYSFSFSLDKDTRDKVSALESSLETYMGRHNYHSDGDDNSESESDSEHSDTELLREADMLHLARIRLGEKHYKTKAEKSKTKQEDEGDKKTVGTYAFTEQNVRYAARFDKVSRKLYPRISVQGGKDKTTIELSKLLDGKSEEYVTHFLKALRGETRKKIAKQENSEFQRGFNDGLEVRMVVLHSDALDYPGNSVVTSAFLEKVTKNNYKQLFVGDALEGSYGAVPSQNIGAWHENPKARNGVYRNIGNFVSDGNIDTTSAKSNVPTLRKFRSMLPFAKGMIRVEEKGRNVDASTKLKTFVEDAIRDDRRGKAESVDPNSIHISPGVDMQETIASFSPEKMALAMNFAQAVMTFSQAHSQSSAQVADANQVHIPTWQASAASLRHQMKVRKKDDSAVSSAAPSTHSDGRLSKSSGKR